MKIKFANLKVEFILKNILVLADGKIAEEFFEKINSKRVTDNRYTVVKSNDLEIPTKIQNQIELVEIDPTSYSKMKRLFRKYDFSMVFIILDTVEDAGEALKIVRKMDKRVRVVMLDMWGVFSKLKQPSTLIFDAMEILSNQLYNNLPNVPIVAQNVGLGEGEIMEVLIPFGSAFAYRHIGSIAQIKWRIVGVYRNKKLIMPNSATMIRPQDTLLILGRPQVLVNIYRRINDRAGLFPEPFGRNLYLILDMLKDEEKAIEYIKEATLMLDRLKDRVLVVKIINPSSFQTLREIKKLQSSRVDISIVYIETDVSQMISSDIQEFDIGLIFISRESFKNREIFREIYEQKKLVYLFGKTPLQEVNKSLIAITQEKEMEGISSIAFYVSETLKLKFYLCNFDPEGDFASKKRIIEHYETLSHIFQYPITIEQRQVNPIREIKKSKNVLFIAPFNRDINRGNLYFNFLSTKIKRYVLDYIPHPKLLVPIEI